MLGDEESLFSFIVESFVDEPELPSELLSAFGGSVSSLGGTGPPFCTAEAVLSEHEMQDKSVSADIKRQSTEVKSFLILPPASKAVGKCRGKRVASFVVGMSVVSLDPNEVYVVNFK